MLIEPDPEPGGSSLPAEPRRRLRSRYELALTFDDGPDPRGTPRVLDALDRAGVGATFFVIGEQVRAHPDLVERALAAGHRLELHCDRHLRHDTLSASEIRLDAEQALIALAAHDVRPTLWRTPWGVVTDDTRRVALELDLELIHWSLDPEDWAGAAASTLLARLPDDALPGAIVLLHDGLGPGATRTSCAPTAELIEPLLARGAERGLLATQLEPAASASSESSPRTP